MWVMVSLGHQTFLSKEQVMDPLQDVPFSSRRQLGTHAFLAPLLAPDSRVEEELRIVCSYN